ncbi:hypothetical protein DSL72_006018 [Monilinia vaccinii-corymbosi]|uniref:Uncharacterized protein n=1 Tax=Monilinia vaccinii-corymbosi TaxID=61207 RepID=A0A8A3PHH3_9HELO|nr:hypothetical protein DSL72_006018 [Monilinia vaccinii-corymbosi]
MANNDINTTPMGAHEPALAESMLQQQVSSSQEIKGGDAGNAIAIQSTGATATTAKTTFAHSQSTTDAQEHVFTPPASDIFSSQSTDHDEDPLSQLSQLSQLAAAQQPLESNPSTTPPKIHITLNASQKRSADGHFKSNSSKSPSPQGPRPVREHVRNTSTVSNASSVAAGRFGELSSELRTRLSYAMVKVNNGWESKSINEVETIASQAGSPTSSNSTLNTRQTLLTSPRAEIANIQGQGSRDVCGPRPTVDYDLYARTGTEPSSRTYESFWRDHSTANVTHSYRHNLYPPPSPQSKSLAPPADIRPTAASRRSDSKFSKPPSLPGHSSANSHPSFNNYSAPRTPNPSAYHHSEHVMTSGQKTIQEQDAIVSLILMGSPGNSQTLGPTLLPPQGNQDSPLRAEFSLQMTQNGKSKLGSQSQRRVEFAESVSSGGSDNGYAGASHRTSALRNKVHGGRRITDRMLDEMVDESSDEEVELPLPQGRRITGRV